MKRTKPGKAARVDEVCPELLRADMEEFASRLTKCYNRLWETETWPKVWKKGPVKVFNKGDLRECNSWRGVTLLPVINKIFCRMLLGADQERRRQKTSKEAGWVSTQQKYN